MVQQRQPTTCDVSMVGEHYRRKNYEDAKSFILRAKDQLQGKPDQLKAFLGERAKQASLDEDSSDDYNQPSQMFAS